MKKFYKVLIVLCFVVTNNVSWASSSVLNKLTAKDIYKKCSPAIVYIVAGDSQGSGVIVDERGTLITNFHVVSNADNIIVKHSDGSMYYVNGVKYLSVNPDIAILTIGTTRRMQFVSISNSPVETGEVVHAIGSPMGLENSISSGIVSKKNIKIDNSEYIQFTAPVSHGSSGGALFNDYGDLIGIVTSGYENTTAQNLNFALHTTMVSKYINCPITIIDKSFQESISDVIPESKYLDLATYYYKAGDFKNGIIYLEKFKGKGCDPELYNLLGESYLRLAILNYNNIDEYNKNINNCIEDYANAIKLNYINEQELFGLSIALLAKNDLKGYNICYKLLKKFNKKAAEDLNIYKVNLNYYLNIKKYNDYQLVLSKALEYMSNLNSEKIK